jgi:hypothetical protein
MQRLYCPTETAILLVGIPDANGVLKFPVAGDPPGLHVAARPLISIDQQLVAAASEALGKDIALHLSLEQEFADDVALPDGKTATLYVGTVAKTAGIQAPGSYQSMPDILRAMAKTRGRLPYLRAWQVLTGGLTMTTKALDLDEVKKHFLKDEPQ